MNQFSFLLLSLLVCGLALASEVVVLNSENFEKLTQAASGSTTGDWMIKFYAPWCGHCKTLAPIWDEIADELKKQDSHVNIAKVDVTQNHDLGTRFDIKGFPTIKLLSQGQVYSYKGRRTKEDLISFAKGGFKDFESEAVPEKLTMVGEVLHIFKQAYKQASRDIQTGNYFSPDIILIAMPVVFLLMVTFVFCLPMGDDRAPREPAVRESSKKQD